MTFQQLFDEYIDRKTKSGNLEISTVIAVKGATSRLAKLLKDIELNDISAEMLKEYKKQLGYTEFTARNVLKKLNPFFNYAVENRYMTENPISNFKLRTVALEKKFAYTSEEVNQLIKAAEQEDKRVYIALLLMFFGGLRREEVCGLKWKDVDFQESAVTPRWALAQGLKGCYSKNLKNQYSERIVYYPKSVLKKIEKYRSNDFEFVLKGRKEYLCPNSLTVLFIKVRNKAGLDKGSLYTARHTHASILVNELGAKCLPAIAKRMGHKDASITLKTYSHAFEKDDIRLADSLDEILNLTKPLDSQQKK